MTDKSYLNRVRKLSEKDIPSFMRKALITLKYREKVAFLKKNGAVPFTEEGFQKIGWDFYKKTEEPDAGSIWAITAIQNDKGEEEKWLVVNVDENDQILRGVKASIKKKAQEEFIVGDVVETVTTCGMPIELEEGQQVTITHVLTQQQRQQVAGEGYDYGVTAGDPNLLTYVKKDDIRKVSSKKKISHKPGAIVQVIVPRGHINEKYNGKIGEVIAAVPDRSQVNFKDMPPLWFEDNTITEVIPCPTCNDGISLYQLKAGRIRCRCDTVYSRKQLEKIVRKAQNVIFWFDDPKALKNLRYLQGPPERPAEEDSLGAPVEKEVGGEEAAVVEKEASVKKTAARIFSDFIDDYRFVWHYTWGEEYVIEGGDPDNYPDDYIQPGIIGLQRKGLDEDIATLQLNLEDYNKLTNDRELDPDEGTEVVENLTQYFKEFIARGDLEKVSKKFTVPKSSMRKAQIDWEEGPPYDYPEGFGSKPKDVKKYTEVSYGIHLTGSELDKIMPLVAESMAKGDFFEDAVGEALSSTGIYNPRTSRTKKKAQEGGYDAYVAEAWDDLEALKEKRDALQEEYSSYDYDMFTMTLSADAKAEAVDLQDAIIKANKRIRELEGVKTSKKKTAQSDLVEEAFNRAVIRVKQLVRKGMDVDLETIGRYLETKGYSQDVINEVCADDMIGVVIRDEEAEYEGEYDEGSNIKTVKQAKEKVSKIVKEAQGGSQFEALRGGGGGSSDQLIPMGWSVSESKIPKLPEEAREEEVEEEVEEIVIRVNPSDKSVKIDFEGEKEEEVVEEEVGEFEGAKAPSEEPIEKETEEKSGLAGGEEEVPVNF